MRLQDAVNLADPFFIQSVDGEIHRLPGAADFVRELNAAPVRYVLDDASAALVTMTAFAEKNMLCASLDLLRFPSTAFWMEWSEQGRAKYMKKFDLMDSMRDTSMLGRAGAFVKADESGRRGEIAIFWENADGAPDLAPFLIEFDFDDPHFNKRQDKNLFVRGLQLNEPSPLQALFNCTRYRLMEPWRAYYQRNANTPAEFKDTVHRSLCSISGDLPFIAAFCLVLSARGALRYQASDLKRLNTARLRKGRSALLDHLTVSLELDAVAGDGGASGGDLRTAPRLHHVCGHLVRRGAGLHWRRSHLRGNPQLGLISTRTIRVRTSASARRVN
ncbi:MAG: hypothetical protein GXP06_03625 [Alphaproteobacteria bacterium]|nr:hypothetical protein [Alphaproteobacteria bacterium]